MHFTRQSTMARRTACRSSSRARAITSGTRSGKQYFDGLAGLFVVNAGHGRRRLAEAAAQQASELAFFPLWSYAHPAAIELADRLADYAPGDLNRVFFSTRRRRGGRDRVQAREALLEAAWASPTKHKVISRAVAYHGTPQGALAITGIPAHEGDVRAGHARRLPGAEHELSTARRRWAPRPRPRGLRALGGRPHRGDDPLRGAGDGRGRVPRAGAELRRMLPSPARLLRRGCARSATATTCCSSPTRSSARSAASATCSRATPTATCPT